MKKFIVLIVLALALLTAGAVYAQGPADGIIEGSWPEGVDVWRVDGRIFVRDVLTGELVWFCAGGCTGTCPYDPSFFNFNFTATPTPNGDETPTPNGDETPTPPVDFTPTPPVDETPTPPVDETPTPPVDPTKKAACNRGVGNSGNECDPGNSSGQGGGGGRPAGEDRDENDTGPGNSGDNGNQKDRR